jgi:RHS repeat-associated protein
VSETVPNSFRYASYYYDTSTGLYYLWHRYYHPELRRFLTQDLVFGSLSDPACLNPYAYVLDNPVSLADPTGLKPKYGWPGGQLDIPDAGFPNLLGPLEDMATDAAEWYAQMAAATDNPVLGGLYELGLLVCSPMVPENAWAMETVLTLGLSWRWLAGAAGSQTAKAGVCPTSTGHHSVYFGGGPGGTRYIGMTGREPWMRWAEHYRATDGKQYLDFRNVESGMTPLDARILEQTLINQQGGIGSPGLLNKINSIDPKFWDLYGIPKP